MKKTIFKLGIFVISILVLTTGCNSNNKKIKTYDKSEQPEIVNSNSNEEVNEDSNAISNEASNKISNEVSSKTSNKTSNKVYYKDVTVQVFKVEQGDGAGIYVIKGINSDAKEVWTITTNVTFVPGSNDYYPFYEGKKYFYFIDNGMKVLKAVNKNTGDIVWQTKDIKNLLAMSYCYEVNDRVLFIPFSHGSADYLTISEFNINTGVTYKTKANIGTYLTKKYGEDNWGYYQYKYPEKDYIINGNVVNIGDVEDYSTHNKYSLYYNVNTYELVIK